MLSVFYLDKDTNKDMAKGPSQTLKIPMNIYLTSRLKKLQVLHIVASELYSDHFK